MKTKIIEIHKTYDLDNDFKYRVWDVIPAVPTLCGYVSEEKLKLLLKEQYEDYCNERQMRFQITDIDFNFLADSARQKVLKEV